MFLQMIPAISISGGKPAMLPPLCIVVVVSMIKDAFEDYMRHKKDNDENSSKCNLVENVGENCHIAVTKWSDLKVG